MKISILVPVYNERTLAARSLGAVLAAPLPEDMEREVVVVDDCSTDGTSDILIRLAQEHPEIRLHRHSVNQGKGAAVRTAIRLAGGEFCLIQDADLEYDPADYPALLRPLLDGRADAVFGSRYLAGVQRRVLPFWHSQINKVLTTISNMFSNLQLTDMETCYKAFRTDLLKSIPIRSDRFGIEPEITMKAAKRNLRIYEVPISYHGRTHAEGKKIGWMDGIKALGVIFYFWIIDDLYEPAFGRAHLNNLTGTPQYVNWMVDLIRPHLGDRVLELGAGIGTAAARLIERRVKYVATEKDSMYLHTLRNRFLRTPHVEVRKLDPEDPEAFVALNDSFDTIVCANVLEYVADPAAVLRSAAGALAEGGRIILLMPQVPGVFGSIDRGLGSRRRFKLKEIRPLLEAAGLVRTSAQPFNRLATPIWFVFSRVLRSKRLGRVTLKIFDKLVWLRRLLDPILPWPALSVVVVARRQNAG